ncbi:MAG TPA: ribonuclease HII [Candidatus Angelobacter sp.]|nr:ribonuclease HII [Candidatus Angelobacter sp.]
MILGIDEVGRGPWAGPLVVGAVVLGGASIEGLTDSKKLSKKQRERLDIEIREKATGIGLGWVEAEKIDEIGLTKALALATKLAVEQIKVSYSEIIIDGTINFLSDTSKGKYVTTLKKADLLIPAVSAASIIAKVARDNFMSMQDKVHPGYEFKKHVGYGTAKHIEAINKLGVTSLHRLSFAPLRKFKFSKVVTETTTTKQIGDSAETVAAKYLQKHGHKILDRNWKTKYCEIDIVSQLDDTIYFTEVKYRKKADQGGGLAVITPKKIRQMKFAAEFYVLSNQLSDVNMRLAAMSLYGKPPIIEVFLEI